MLIYYKDTSFKYGDRVVEYVPHPNQEDGPFDDGPRTRYVRRSGIFLGNVDKDMSYNSYVRVDGKIEKIAHRDLYYDSRWYSFKNGKKTKRKTIEEEN